MKKQLIIFASILVVSIGNAQNKKFQVSPIISVEFPFVIQEVENNVELDYTFRPSVGASFKVLFGERFALQPEVSLQLREVKISNNLYSAANERISNVYIIVPLLINYSITDNVSLLLGPRIGVDLSFSATYSTGSNGTSSSSTGESPEFAGVFGVQYHTPIKLFVSLKGHYGFTSPDYADSINEAGLMVGIGRFF